MSITEKRYGEIIGAYGSDEKRWPKDERAGALAFQAAHKQRAKEINDAQALVDTALRGAAKPAANNSLLMARILKQAGSMPQDGAAANGITADAPRPLLGSTPWKSLAATLIISTGMGFGFGQAAAASSDIAQAEALLAASADAQYDYDWLEETP